MIQVIVDERSLAGRGGSKASVRDCNHDISMEFIKSWEHSMYIDRRKQERRARARVELRSSSYSVIRTLST